MFKDRLIELRKSKKLTQEQMAEKLGVHRGTYANYERGHRQPDYDTLVQISDFFDVSTDYLLKGNLTKSEAEKILDDPNSQVAARDGDISREEALKAIEWLLEKEKGRKPGDKQFKK